MSTITEPTQGNPGTGEPTRATGTASVPVPAIPPVRPGTPQGTPAGTQPGTGSGTPAGTERGNPGSRRSNVTNQGTERREPRAAVPGNTRKTPAGSRGNPIELPRGRMAAAWFVISVGLTLVIAAPTVLSSQDLYHWAADPRGLGLEGIFPYFVPAALDLAAIVCIAMTLVAAWRTERAQVFALLVWVFAGTSAYAQHQHGAAARDAGGAQDAWWAMPAFALLGPLLLEVTLHTFRRWVRSDAGQNVRAARWLVSPVRSFRAWKVSVRENLDPRAAWEYGRDVQMLADMSPVDAVIYAATAAQTSDPYEVRQWLAARGTLVAQEHLDAAAGTALRPVLAVPAPQVPAPSGPLPPAPAARVPAGTPVPAGDGFPFPLDESLPVPVSPPPAGRVPGSPVPGTEGTRGPFAADGTDLGPLYSRHRVRLEAVRVRLLGWDTIPVADLTLDAIKTAGSFAKQQYACEIRKILLHERGELAA